MRRAVRRLPAGILARERRGGSLSDRVHRRADAAPVSSRRSSPRNTAAPDCRCAPPRSFSRKSATRAATPPRATRRCTRWARSCATAATRRSASTCRRSPRASCRLQAFGVTEPTTGSDTTQLKTRAIKTRRRLHAQGPEDLHVARAAFGSHARARAHDADRGSEEPKSHGISTFLIDIRESLGKGLEIRPIKMMVNHHTTRSVLRRPARFPPTRSSARKAKAFATSSTA